MKNNKLLVTSGGHLLKECFVEPCPVTITVTFAGVTNCGVGDCGGPPTADTLNGVWTLNEGANCEYTYSDAEVNIIVNLSETFGLIAANVQGVVAGTAFDNFSSGPVNRKDTINNERLCGGETFECTGTGGTCYID